MVLFTCSPHTGNAVKVEPRDLFGVECSGNYMRNYPQNNVLTSIPDTATQICGCIIR